MKSLKYMMSLILLISGMELFAQTDKVTTQKIIDAQNYVFVATAALPLNTMDINRVLSRLPGYTGAGPINLTGSNYDLNVKKDSLEAFLPFYGRAFNARIGRTNEGGIKFKSKDFSYIKEKRKKGGWIITMKPNDVKDYNNSNYILTLNVTTSGYATLVVNSNNQQSITFNGYLAEQKTKEVN